MAKIFSFPEGDLIEDTGNPIDKQDEVLGFIQNSPVEAANKFREMSMQIQTMADCLNQINAYSQLNKAEWSNQILGIIKNSFN